MQISSTSGTTSTYTSSAYSSSGFSSMISGMDTESLVKSMLSGIQTKIDKQNQQKQQLLWKQDMYRDVISKISSFQTKYFDLTSSTSLRTSSFYNKMTTSSSSSAVKILNASSSEAQDFTVQVAQKATAATVTSGKIGEGSIKLDDIANNLDSFFNSPEQNIKITAGDKSVTVNLWDSECLDDSGNLSVDKAVAHINSQLAENDVNVQASVTDGKLSFTSSGENGAEETKFSIGGSENALATLGLKSKSVGGDGDFTYTSDTAADATKLEKNLPETASINFTLDGKTKAVTIDNTMTADEALSSLKEQLKSAFGSSVTVNDDNTITAKQGQTLSVTGDSEAMGITNGACTRLTTSTKLSNMGIEATDGKYEFSINGTDFTLDGDTTVSQLLSKVNSSDCGAKMVYNSLSDSFTLTSTSTGEGFELNMTGNVADKLFATKTETAGQNAIVNIDGTTFERTSNSFSYNGVSMEIKTTTGSYFDENGNIQKNADGTFKAADGTTETSAEISAARDVSGVVDTIKGFIEDYNTMINDLNELTHATKTYKKYDPLTDEQKKEMKDTEITAWEKNAKEGLLSGDSDISSFLQSMRTALYSKASNGMSLSSFGIDSSSDWKDYGKLEIDEDKLTEALENNASDFISTFQSIATSLNTACKNTANTSSAAPGTLVTIAGVKGKVSESNNTIKSRLDAIADKVSALQNTYDLRKTRYWNQFNSMETSLSNLSSTSSYLTQMLGG